MNRYLLLLIVLLISGFLNAQPLIVDTLVSSNALIAPSIDGAIDPVWDNATAITVNLGETYDVNDPASIMDCNGCHNFNSNISVNLKSVYTSSHIYFLAIWPDPAASFTRGGSWSFTNGIWEKLTPDESEDRISFFWPMGQIVGNPYNTGGCMAKCHTYWPTDTDPHVSTHGIVDDAWLENGRADMWHSKAARGAAYLSASQSGITVDPVTHQVTAGSFSMIGYADDKYVDVWAPDSINGEDGGRYGDAGTSAYSHNRIGDRSRPKFMETAPADYADAMFLTEDEITNGECVGDASTGVSDADAATYWPNYAGFNAVVPERILRQPAGSRADLAFGAVWENGTWTAEIARELQNGNADDIQFDILSEYIWGIAEFDNSRHGYQHRTSRMRLLQFGPLVGISEVSDNIPQSYALAQNFPNPFNPSTTISFSIPQPQQVTISIYDVEGKLVKDLLNTRKAAGSYSVRWDAGDLNSGIYFYRIKAGNFTATKKCILLK